MRYEFRAARIRSPGSGLVELDMVGHVVAFGKGDCAVRGARNGQVDVPAIGFDALFAAPGAGAGFAHAALGLDVTRALAARRPMAAPRASRCTRALRRRVYR